MERVKELSCWNGTEITIKATSDVREELQLGEGRTNQNFIVSAKGGRYFVRIGADLPFYGISRARERAAAAAAAAAGVAPEVWFSSPPDALVVRFVDGRALTEEDVHRAAAAGRGDPILEAIVGAVRRLHAAPVPPELEGLLAEAGGAPGWGGPHLAKWLRYAEDLEYSRLPILDGVRELVARLEAMAKAGLPEASPLRFCHFDLLSDNFVLLNGSSEILLVDFEYSAPGQPLMDLAVLAMGCSLLPGEEQNLLSCYLGDDAGESQVRGFQALKVLAALRETFWGVTAELSRSSALSLDEAADYSDKNYAKFREMLDALDAGEAA
mmetsp:Transcript_16909/g.53102  ORF Transcript_16909/g.53102 Transcript_16909/m.53102 type:complete len:325 (-) Transcript_16909:16-990(-)